MFISLFSREQSNERDVFGQIGRLISMISLSVKFEFPRSYNANSVIFILKDLKLNLYYVAGIVFTALAGISFYIGNRQDSNIDKAEIINSNKEESESLKDHFNTQFDSLDRRIDELEKKMPIDKTIDVSSAIPLRIRQYEDQRKFEKANEELERLLKQSLPTEQTIAIKFHIARNYHLLKKYEQSTASYNEALADLDRSPVGKTPRLKGWIYLNLAMLENERNNLNNALEYYGLAIDFGTSSSNAIVVASGFLGQGYIIGKRGDTRAAIGLYLRAIKLFKQTDFRYGTALTLQRLGYAHREMGDGEKALNYFRELMDIAKKNKFIFLVADAHQEIGGIYLNGQDLSKLDSAEQHFQSSLAFYEVAEDEKNASSYVYGKMGLLEFRRANFSLSLSYHNKALELSKELKDNRGIANEMANIGNVLAAQGKVSEGLDFLFKALALHKNEGYLFGIATDYKLIGSLYTRVASEVDDPSALQNAIKYFRLARQTYLKIGNKAEAAIMTETLRSLGDVS
jgi:tetratricopeptide (TPR) repeat protein